MPTVSALKMGEHFHKSDCSRDTHLLAWRFMNPIEWLKAIHEAFGTPYPRASLGVVGFLGAVCFVAVWLFAAKQVEKGHQVSTTAPARVSGAATADKGSIANTGDGNSFNQSSAPEKKMPKKE